LIILDISYMPTLYEVCVWEKPFPPPGVLVLAESSPNVLFTTDCSATALKPNKIFNKINIHPNPAREFIEFDLTNITFSAKVEFFDVEGNKVLEQKLSENKQISVSNLPKGLYMYKLSNSGNIHTGKVIVK